MSELSICTGVPKTVNPKHSHIAISHTKLRCGYRLEFFRWTFNETRNLLCSGKRTYKKHAPAGFAETDASQWVNICISGMLSFRSWRLKAFLEISSFWTNDRISKLRWGDTAQVSREWCVTSFASDNNLVSSAYWPRVKCIMRDTPVFVMLSVSTRIVLVSFVTGTKHFRGHLATKRTKRLPVHDNLVFFLVTILKKSVNPSQRRCGKSNTSFKESKRSTSEIIQTVHNRHIVVVFASYNVLMLSSKQLIIFFLVLELWTSRFRFVRLHAHVESTANRVLRPSANGDSLYVAWHTRCVAICHGRGFTSDALFEI